MGGNGHIRCLHGYVAPPPPEASHPSNLNGRLPVSAKQLIQQQQQRKKKQKKGQAAEFRTVEEMTELRREVYRLVSNRGGQGSSAGAPAMTSTVSMSMFEILHFKNCFVDTVIFSPVATWHLDAGFSPASMTVRGGEGQSIFVMGTPRT